MQLIGTTSCRLLACVWTAEHHVSFTSSHESGDAAGRQERKQEVKGLLSAALCIDASGETSLWVSVALRDNSTTEGSFLSDNVRRRPFARPSEDMSFTVHYNLVENGLMRNKPLPLLYMVFGLFVSLCLRS